MYEYACAHILRVSFSVSLGWFQNDARAELGSWLVMGMIFYMYVLMSYIVCVSDVYCTYLHVYTYVNVFSERKVVRRIDTVIYIQYTCIRSIYIQYTESYTCIYVKIHTTRIKDRYTYFENIYVRSRYMHVYACICMYLHVYCCFHL